MDFQISRDYIALMYNILYCTEHSPTATSIQIMEKRQDVPYISVLNTMVILQQLKLGTCVPNIILNEYRGTKFLRAPFKDIIADQKIIANMDNFFYNYYGKGFDDYLRYLQDIELTERFNQIL